MIRGSASLMGAPLWNRTEAGLGLGAHTLLSYPSVPLSSSPFDGMKCRDDRRRAMLVMSGECLGMGVRRGQCLHPGGAGFLHVSL
jgi:hypothetical protein